ncbi:hypothetical protein PSQ90_15005 [Devosia rhodophyticola]|uniref:Uncharacterized protein n=1 Tax=Devosia rhodophyticola TaxID=3026423 RepID=A0ABY7YXP2_9HYPH|nr:hypothetical protein [Devosia rhodophyticola]WDR05565.1 hypothetical protein PSQ90_15005 [Devosia rhodophyticola]
MIIQMTPTPELKVALTAYYALQMAPFLMIGDVDLGDRAAVIAQLRVASFPPEIIGDCLDVTLALAKSSQ